MVPQMSPMASHRLSQLKSEDFVTVLFLADTQRAIATLQGVDGANQEGIREFTLRPWHDAAVRQWLQDVGIQSDRAMRDRIRKATHNWPILINRLGTAGTEALTRSCEDLANLPDNPVSTLGSEACFTIAKMAQKNLFHRVVCVIFSVS